MYVKIRYQPKLILYEVQAYIYETKSYMSIQKDVNIDTN